MDKQYGISLKGTALLQGSDLVDNPNLNDYGRILLAPAAAYLDAVEQAKSTDPSIRTPGIVKAEVLGSDIAKLFDMVNGLHALDAIADGKIPNKGIAQAKLWPVIQKHYSQN